MQEIIRLGERLRWKLSDLVLWGEAKAKIRISSILERKARGKLVLVTAMSPSPAGEGKTTVAIGLTDGLN